MVNGANKNNSVGIISGGIDSSLSAYYLNKNGINLESSFCLDFSDSNGLAPLLGARFVENCW